MAESLALHQAQVKEVARTLIQIWSVLHPERADSVMRFPNICGAMEALFDDGEEGAWAQYMPIVREVAAEGVSDD